MTPARFTVAARPLCAIPFAAAALLIAACGGSTSTGSTAVQGADAAGAAVGAAAVTHRAHTILRTHHDPVRTGGVVVHRPWPGTGGGQTNDDNPGRADVSGHSATSQSDPCTLVSRADAQAILDRPIDTPVDAPLGPTCIYQSAGARSLVTVTVEAIDFANIEPHIRSRKQSEVGGRTAYCGTYGQSSVFVPLAGGRVLTITAPCAIGVRFAAEAMPRVKS